VLVADARQYIYLFGAPNSVHLFCHSRRYLLSRSMEGGERDLKKRLETTATAMQGCHDLKSNDEAVVVSLEAQPSGAGKERSKKKIVRKKLKQEVIDRILKEPFEPLEDDDEEEVLEMSEPYRECHAKTRAVLEALAEFDADIIKQYRAKGYAESMCRSPTTMTATRRVRAGNDALGSRSLRYSQ